MCKKTLGATLYFVVCASPCLLNDGGWGRGGGEGERNKMFF